MMFMRTRFEVFEAGNPIPGLEEEDIVKLVETAVKIMFSEHSCGGTDRLF
jgi:hypothetical protein